MECVADVLHHFGRLYAGEEGLGRDAGVQSGCGAAVGLIAVSDQRVRRVVVVAHRASLAQELGVEADAEAVAAFLARFTLDDRRNDGSHGAWHHGAPNDDQMTAWLSRERLPYLFAHTL